MDPAILTGCLGEVRSGRSSDGELTLAGLLLERRLVAPARLGELVELSASGSHPATFRAVDASGEAGLPSVFGPFRVVRELDRGGMGAALEVRNEAGQTLVLKTILPGGADEETRQRFAREAELTARLDHPHVVRIHAADLSHDPPYLVLDYLPGGNLQERLELEGALPFAEVLVLGQKLAAALEHAHARGVLHRDLKPQNVLFDDRGEPRLIDWGLARSVDSMSRELTRSGTMMGTPVYMAPEQAIDAAGVGPEADVYALGAVLFALAAGAPPLANGPLFEVLDRVLHQVPPALSERVKLPGAVGRAADALFAGLLAKDPRERPKLDALRLRLRQLELGQIDQGSSSQGRRRLAAVVLGVLLGAALLGAGAAGALGWSRRARARDLAEHLEWERAHLETGLYGLGTAPIPSVAQLDVARGRLARIGADSDPRLALSESRLRAYAGLLDPKAPPGDGAPGKLVEGRRALAARAFERAADLAEEALRRAEADPEARAARLLAISAATTATTLARQGARFPEEAEALKVRAEALLIERLAGYPSERGWRLDDEADLEATARLAERLGVSPVAWAQGFALAERRWERGLARTDSPQAAEALATGLGQLRPPTLGERVRGRLGAFVTARARASDAILRGAQGESRDDGQAALEEALLVMDALAWIEPSSLPDPLLVHLAEGGRTAFDRGRRGRVSGLVGLFLLGLDSELRLSELANHLELSALQEIQRSRPRPSSQARAVARLLAEGFGRGETSGAELDREIQAWEVALERPRRDVGRTILALCDYSLARMYLRRVEDKRKAADEGRGAREDPAADLERVVELTRDALRLGFALRHAGEYKALSTSVLAAAELERGQPEAALAALSRIVSELRVDLQEVEERFRRDRRGALAKVLRQEGALLGELGRWEDALRRGQEVVELVALRVGMAEDVAEGRVLQARALHALKRDPEAWEVLAVEQGTFGLSAEAARVILRLGLALGHEAEAQAALDQAFRDPYRSDPHWTGRSGLRLDVSERERIAQTAIELGYTIPADAYRR